MKKQYEVGDSLGRYELLSELGRGGMAVVYRALDTSLDREVALKVMHLHLWGREEHTARFLREARAAAALRHPNIVEVHDFSEGDEAEGIPGYIVSELVPGPNLKEFMIQHGRPLPEVAAMIGMKLASALAAAHAGGIIHRDLKPENVIIVEEEGRVVLTDFGIARINEGEDVTQTGAMIGSPAYMSPEQARGQRVDHRSDLFSLGTLLYQLGTGVLPFKGTDPLSTVLRVVEGRFEPPLKVNPTLGTRLDRLIRRLMELQPAERYPNAEAVEQALRQVTAEAGISDVDAELEAFFKDPAGFSTTLVGRVIQSSTDLAREALDSGEIPRALALCDRVLALDANHAGALELMERLTARSGLSRRLLLMGGGILLTLGIIASIGILLWRNGEDTSNARSPIPDARRPIPDSRPPTPHPHPETDARPPETVDMDMDMDMDVDRDRDRGRRRPPRRRPDAAPQIPDLRPPHDLASSKPDLPTHAELKILLGPHCEASVDSKPVGTSPMPDKVHRLSPGSHHVTCRFQDGHVFDRTITLKSGQRLTLRTPPAPVRLQLKNGDAVRIRDRVYREDFSLKPKRYRVELLRGNRALGSKYIVVPTRGCTLVDEPDLTCR